MLSGIIPAFKAIQASIITIKLARTYCIIIRQINVTLQTRSLNTLRLFNVYQLNCSTMIIHLLGEQNSYMPIYTEYLQHILANMNIVFLYESKVFDSMHHFHKMIVFYMYIEFSLHITTIFFDNFYIHNTYLSIKKLSPKINIITICWLNLKYA